MRLLLLTYLLVGCAGADTEQSSGVDTREEKPRRQEKRLCEEDVSVKDIIKAVKAELQSGARDAANNTVSRLEERLAELEQQLTEYSALLAGTLTALTKISERLSEWQTSGRRVAVATPGGRPHGKASGPQPSGRPSPTAGHVLGESCRLDSECSELLTNTVCGDDGHCECASGLLRGPGETCRPAPGLGGECRVNWHCAARTVGAVCSLDRTCRCPTDRITFLNECLPFPPLNQSCQTTEDCRRLTDHAVCSSHRCVCPRRTWNYRHIKCRPGVEPGKPCLYDRDCSTFREINACLDGVCQVRQCDPRSDTTTRFRLVGGNSCNNGYVEFTYDSGTSWNFVCDSNWTKADATVLCAYMGFDWGEPQRLHFSTSQNVTRFLWVDDLECEGTEPNPTLCVWHEGRTNCEVGEVAMVKCFRKPTEPPTTEPPPTESAAPAISSNGGGGGGPLGA